MGENMGFDTHYLLDHIEETNIWNSNISQPELPADTVRRVIEMGLEAEEHEAVLLFAADILAFQTKSG
ncbi:MAG: hypothetical protein CM15mP49_15570 [Actinomycetota bacterium]|nr:MAG: hypothetical protein CM15mP49_15570 [Actinomycetota bacterium]